MKTRIRESDGSLVCDRCGAVRPIDYPTTAAAIVAVLDAFKKEHAKCGENR